MFFSFFPAQRSKRSNRHQYPCFAGCTDSTVGHFSKVMLRHSYEKCLKKVIFSRVNCGNCHLPTDNPVIMMSSFPAAVRITADAFVFRHAADCVQRSAPWQESEFEMSHCHQRYRGVVFFLCAAVMLLTFSHGFICTSRCYQLMSGRHA